MTLTELQAAEAAQTEAIVDAETNLLTADDLLRLSSKGVRGELIRGVLVETMVPGQEHGKIIVRLSAFLFNFVEPRRLGTLVAADSGVWLERDPDTVRGPDIAFTSAQRLPLGTRIPGYTEVIPDLVIEVRSPNDTRRDIHDKARMWISHGVRLVWAIHPNTRTVDIHQPDQPVRTLTADASLDGADILPGFTCELTKIFDT